MAIYSLQLKPISRGKGTNAHGTVPSMVALTAYINGKRFHDDRNDTDHDFSKKRDCLFSTLCLPFPFDESEVTWTSETLWNAVEAQEKRKDARTGYEIIAALPHELSSDGRERLA